MRKAAVYIQCRDGNNKIGTFIKELNEDGSVGKQISFTIADYAQLWDWLNENGWRQTPGNGMEYIHN